VSLAGPSNSFTAATNSPYGVGIAPYAVAVGDFNGDGVPDLATANYSTNNVTVLLGSLGRLRTGPGQPVRSGRKSKFRGGGGTSTGTAFWTLPRQIRTAMT